MDCWLSLGSSSLVCKKNPVLTFFLLRRSRRFFEIFQEFSGNRHIRSIIEPIFLIQMQFTACWYEVLVWNYEGKTATNQVVILDPQKSGPCPLWRASARRRPREFKKALANVPKITSSFDWCKKIGGLGFDRAASLLCESRSLEKVVLKSGVVSGVVNPTFVCTVAGLCVMQLSCYKVKSLFL